MNLGTLFLFSSLFYSLDVTACCLAVTFLTQSGFPESVAEYLGQAKMLFLKLITRIKS